MATQIPLKIYLIPYLAPGHFIPLCEMGCLFAAQGHHVTVITTTSNTNLIHHTLSVHLLHFPSKEVGLPDGVENYISITDMEGASKLYKAISLMRTQIESFILSYPPDCIVADMYYPWTSDLALRLNIPRLHFQGFCIFSHCLSEEMRPSNLDAPHHRVRLDDEPFEVPNLPDRVVMTRSQLPKWVLNPDGYTQLMELHRQAEMKSYGILVNTFYEMEPAYTDLYSKTMGVKVFHLGPANLIHRIADEKAERGHKTVVGKHECLDWLDSKEPASVLYVCFGSGMRFPDEQLYEIASGLASSGAHFIWVVLGKNIDTDTDTDTSKWLPSGFQEEMKKTGRGMIIRGYAPQVLILDHEAVGGFMTHCGWNSLVEAISAGVPMVTWPLTAEQFYNEKLATQVLKIGVEAGSEEWSAFTEVGRKKVVRREKVEAAVRRLMVVGYGGDEVAHIRKTIKELGEKARRAVQEGGSSHTNLLALIQDLQRLRQSRLAATSPG